MLLEARHPNLKGLEKTNLTAAVSAAGTALTVASNQGFVADAYVVIGPIGFEKSEIRKISTVSGNTTINLVGDALAFDHGKDTIVTSIPFNQVRFYKASSSGGSFSVVQTVSIDADSATTRYDYTSGLSTDYFKFAYYNSTSAVESSLSQEWPGTGLTGVAVGTLIDDFYATSGVKETLVTREEVLGWFRRGVERALQKKEDWKDLEAEATFTSTASTNSKTLSSIASDIRRVVYVIYKQNFGRLGFVSKAVFDNISASNQALSTTGDPTVFTIWNGTIYMYPTPATTGDTVYVGYQKYPADIDQEPDTVIRPLATTLVPFAFWQLAIRKGESGTKLLNYQRDWEEAVNQATESDRANPIDSPKTMVSKSGGW